MVRVTLREREDWRAAVLGAQVSPLSLLGDGSFESNSA